MNARFRKAWEQLRKADQDIINRVKTEEVRKEVIHTQAELQKIWLQLACIVLNRCFGFGRKRLLLFLGTWREIYRFNSKLKSKAEQTEWLRGEMDRIFGKDGYPYKYIDKLEDVA